MSSLQRLVLALSISAAIGNKHSNNNDESIDRSMFNFQTGIDLGSTYAGGITYDKEHNRLFITGGTYARGFFEPEYNTAHLSRGPVNSDCFVSAIQLADLDDTESYTRWEEPTRLGYVSDTEACSTVHFRDGDDRIFLGASASGETFSGKTDAEGDQLPLSKDVALFGEVISMSLDHIYKTAPILPQNYLFGGHGFYTSEVNYPFAITSNPNIGNNDTEIVLEHGIEQEPIYVASLYSKYVGELSPNQETDTEIDLTNPYIDGNVWGIAIQKININYSNATSRTSIVNNVHMERVWMNNFETTNYENVQATDMKFVNGKLLLAGSTRDIGTQFAGEQRDQFQNYNDYDGFIVKIDPETGKVAEDNVDEEVDGEKMKLRIQTTPGADEIIQGICLHPANNETGYVPYVYVVGYSAGIIDKSDGNYTSGGFVMQVDLHTMEIQWKDEIQGVGIEAIDCAVTDDGQLLYVSGNAKNGSVLPDGGDDHDENKIVSHGGDDVWVRQYYAPNGGGRWQIQLGSEEDETLAKGGSLVIDNTNNAIIYGNTRGSIGRERLYDMDEPDNTNDIFVLTVSSTGGYLAPDSNPIFQIPRFYFGKTDNTHIIAISLFIIIALIVLCVVLSNEAEWNKIDLIEFVKDVLPQRKKNKIITPSGEDKALNIKEVDSTETDDSSSEEEEDNFIICNIPSRHSRTSQHSYSVSRPRRERFEEEKTEIEEL